jgi:hypothetical protein
VTASDSTHPVLFVESKLRDRHTTRTLHDATKKRAAKERKIPVLALFDKQRHGCLIVVHSDDLMTVVAEYAAALSDEERDRLCVQQRLMCSAGVRPAGGRAETP